MSSYIVLEKISVQQANAVAGFTWGFPAITNFLGFIHNLSRKLEDGISLTGCGVVSHHHQIYAYQANSRYSDFEFIQTKNPADTERQAADLNSKDHKPPPIIEEGKMYLVVSLIIEYEGSILNGENGLRMFKEQLENLCYQQRLAGGTITDIRSIEIFNANTEKDNKRINRKIKNLLLPGFILMDRANYLEKHYLERQKEDSNAELFDAWLDFIALKQKAKPEADLINKHFIELGKNDKNNQIFQIWNKHLEKPYEQEKIPTELVEYHFANNDFDKKLLEQWKNYCNPNEKTDATWEYMPKPQSGYLVPIMNGYKAISAIYPAGEVENTRNNKTKTCFVEAVHSIAQWQGVHRLSDISDCIWEYDFNEINDGFYLCKQKISFQSEKEALSQNTNAESFLKNLN